MDSINLNLNDGKRIFTVNVSQSMNLNKMIREFIESHSLDDVEILYVGGDKRFFDAMKFDHYFYDFFREVMVSPIDIEYKLIQDLPNVKYLIVYLDEFVDEIVLNSILTNINMSTKLIYMYDNLVVDYSDGVFMKRYSVPDSNIGTFNRRTDNSPNINILLNKIKKNNIPFLTDPELTNDNAIITYESIKDDELQTYDVIISLNNDDIIGEYTARLRNLACRGFLPEERDKMINYVPIETIGVDEFGDSKEIFIPTYSEMKVISMVTPPDLFQSPVYKFEYIDFHGDRYEIEIPINTNFIDAMNSSSVDRDGTPLSFSGYKLYYAYVLPLFALKRRYDRVLILVSNFVLSKSALYTGIKWVYERFKLKYDSNTYIS